MRQEIVNEAEKKFSASLRQEIIEAADQKFDEMWSAIEQDVKEKLSTEIRQSIMSEIRSEQEKAAENLWFEKLKDQAQAKKLNLLMFGISETDRNESEIKLADKFLREKLRLPNIKIGAAYRLGSDSNKPVGRTCPILVKFKNPRDRWAVWNKKRVYLRIKRIQSGFGRTYRVSLEWTLEFYNV